MSSHIPLPTPPKHPAYSWRPARREDASAIYQMLLEVESVDQRGFVESPEDILRDFEHPECNPATDTIQAFSADGRLAAWGWVFSPPATENYRIVWVSGEVHPNHRQRGLGNFILSWMEARARQILTLQPEGLNKYIRTNAPQQLHDRLELFEQHGFQHVRSAYRMLRDLDQPIPEPSMPDGVALLAWQTDLDHETFLAFNSSFSDHWGWIPNSEELWRLRQTGHPSFHPELSFQAIAENQDGRREVVGFSVNQIIETQHSASGLQVGWIQDLGVIRPWRHKGIATALLCASMLAFRQADLKQAGLGVDTENLSGALRIYERLGFYPIQNFVTYQKCIKNKSA